MPTDAARAAKLKEEGNKLFAAKKYDLASKIYGQAIALNASDAALWANRAACALSLRRYVNKFCISSRGNLTGLA